MKNIYDSSSVQKYFNKLCSHLDYTQRTSFFVMAYKRYVEKQQSEVELPTFKVTREDIDAIFDKHFYAV